MNKLRGFITVILLVVLFVSLNLIVMRTLNTARLDLTENRLYTLTDAARRIARGPEEPVTLRLYLSRGLIVDQPQLADRASFVEEKLRAIARSSGGKVRLEIIDPEPASAAEDEALAEGLQAIPSEQGNIFFGLVAENSVDGREVIPVFNFRDARFEEFLEFEIAKVVDTLARIDRPRVGLVSSIPVQGSPVNRFTGQTARRPYRIVQEIESQFELVPIERNATTLPDDLDALVIIHPKKFNPGLLYAIDQYLLRGGRAMIFLDPHCEADTSDVDPGNPLSGYIADRSSEPLPFLDAWGLTMREGLVAADLETALAIGTRSGGQPIRAVQYLGLGSGLSGQPETISADDPVTGRITAMILGTAGVFDLIEDAPVTWEPLLQTSTRASTLDATMAALPREQAEVLAEFAPGQDRLVLAARVSGTDVPTAFPEGPPAESTAAPDAHLPVATAPLSLVVVGDCDMLADGYWVREINLGGYRAYERFADNGAFVLNILDQMAGSPDLVALRARGAFLRPLVRLDEMEREAEAAIAQETAAVDERIEEAERRINEIQAGRSDLQDGLTSLRLTPEQETALAEAQLAIADGRRSRREIIFNLRQEVEELKTQIQLLNMGAVPGLLCVFAITLAGYRSVRRRLDRRRIRD